MKIEDFDLKEVQQELTGMVQEQPLQTVLMAVGAGLGLALIASSAALRGPLRAVALGVMPTAVGWLGRSVQEFKVSHPSQTQDLH